MPKAVFLLNSSAFFVQISIAQHREPSKPQKHLLISFFAHPAFNDKVLTRLNTSLSSFQPVNEAALVKALANTSGGLTELWNKTVYKWDDYGLTKSKILKTDGALLFHNVIKVLLNDTLYPSCRQLIHTLLFRLFPLTRFSMVVVSTYKHW
jgi:hypothetical protein